MMEKNGASFGEILDPQVLEDQKRQRKSHGASYGHVKRQIKEGKVLKGEVLELALGVLGQDDLSKKMAAKLKTGQSLDDYELHLMLDVFLLHARLAG
jgi:hypothetical protein